MVLRSTQRVGLKGRGAQALIDSINHANVNGEEVLLLLF